MLLLILAFCGLSGISFHSGETTISYFLFILFSLISSSFLFLSSFFLVFLSLGSLFSLMDFILVLTLEKRIRFLNFFRLIISRIESYFQGLMSLSALLIEMSTFLNFGLGLNLIGYTDKVVARYVFSNIGNL